MNSKLRRLHKRQRPFHTVTYFRGEDSDDFLEAVEAAVCYNVCAGGFETTKNGERVFGIVSIGPLQLGKCKHAGHPPVEDAAVKYLQARRISRPT